MNEDFESFEAELRSLRPTEPSPRLHRSVAAAIDADAPAESSRPVGNFTPRRGVPARQGRRLAWRWTAYSALPIAAGLAVWLFSDSSVRPHKPRSLEATHELLKPVSAKDILYAAHDEGLVTLDNGVPARKHRLEYIGTVTWRDPKTNASLTWTIPREEVRVVPVRYE